LQGLHKTLVYIHKWFGRGLRLYPGKEKLILIDLVGATGKNNICTAPSLIGLDLTGVPKSEQDAIQGDLFELPELIIQKTDCPESWIRNIEIVNIWAKEQSYNMHNVNWFKMPNGDLVLNLKGTRLVIPSQNELGKTTLNNESITMQQAFDKAYNHLIENYADQKYIWDISVVKKWGKTPASDKQKELIKKRLKNFDTSEVTKAQAMMILNRMFYKGA